MKNRVMSIRALGGINQLLPQPELSASEIRNWIVDEDTGGWSTRFGYERYNPVPTNGFNPFQTLLRIDSVYIHSRRNRAMETVLLTSQGTLYYINDVTGTMTLTPLQSSRKVPTNNDVTTQYVPYGKFTIILNGQDEPLKFDGWPIDRSNFANVPLFTTLGFIQRPEAPSVWQVKANQGADKDGDSISIWFERRTNRGLGIPSVANEKINKFKYKVSFISETGSESPLSEASEIVTWTSSPTYAEQRYAVAIEIPTGEDNVVARNVYRTKNFSDDGGNDETFYYVDTIRNNVDELYYDSLNSGALGSVAPNELDSVVFPAPKATVGIDFQGCLFLNGGTTDAHTLYFSNPLKPDQFGAFDYITVGNSEGGGITALHTYYSTLLVFRERAIDVVSGSYPNFQLTQVSRNVGTVATNTITTIPEIGVVFLADDAVYLFSGGGAGVYGGAVAQIQKISNNIHKTIKSMNKAVLSRAVAAYSSKFSEWHCYFAQEGSEKPNIGIVYHLDKQGWSLRDNTPVSALTVDRAGNLIFGHNTGAVSAGDPAGLFVLSHRRTKGQSKVGDTIVDNDAFTSTYFSRWHDFGNPSKKKKVHHVVLYCLTAGDTALPLTHYIDFAYTGIEATSMIQQRPDHVDQFVYDKAVLDRDTWENQFLTQIRYSVASNACSTFAFEIRTENDTTIIGYDIHYTEIDTKIIGGKPA